MSKKHLTNLNLSRQIQVLLIKFYEDVFKKFKFCEYDLRFSLNGLKVYTYYTLNEKIFS